ncbi:MAG: DUF2231 domain-containing protein [Pseudomonadota bacterium]|nr:DUF2231 domain-containing protein [Pseudomonadota bacterium]
MQTGTWRKAAFAAAAILLASATVVHAHDDPSKMGAGPGAEHSVQPPGSLNNADMKALSDQGTAPVMADGSTPAADPGDAMEGMDHGSMEGMDHDEGADNSDKPFGKRLMIWLGKLHTVAIHFPIAMIVGAFLVEVLGIVRKRRIWRSAARIMLVVGALGALVAAPLGWFAGGFYLWDRNLILTAHRYLGMAIVIAAPMLAWAGLRRFHEDREGDKFFVVLLGLLTLAVLIQGFLGGTFMHGGLRHMAF